MTGVQTGALPISALYREGGGEGQKNDTEPLRHEREDFSDILGQEAGKRAAQIAMAGLHNAAWVINTASYAHMYLFCLEGRIIGCGSISSYWGREDESILLTVFVAPQLHGQGIGRKIIETLENDDLYIRARRVEIPASITACEFYRKLGYDYKDGIRQLDKDNLYRLEKFKISGEGVKGK